MSLLRHFSADSRWARILIAGKSVLDIGAMLIRSPSPESLRLARLILSLKPKYTMVKNAHLVSLYNLVQEADKRGLQGDLVECGVWNGGSAALMAAATRSGKHNLEERSLWLFDSFEGLPRPGDKDGKKAINAYFTGRCKGDAKNVEKAFATINLSTARVTIVPGWFEATLEQASIDDIALLHIDADWYDSVRLVLDIFYDRVTPGGFIVLDDYGFWPGCSEAVHDFLRERDISDDVITMVGEHGAYFQKPQPHTVVDGCPPLNTGGT